jgi:pyruvate-ferredoxin/flavodoxin oxidoreductase
VASIAFAAKDLQTTRAFLEAESYPGPSLIIAYSHCIAHGYDLAYGAEQQKLAVNSGYWPLYRFDPRRRALGETPLQLDATNPKVSLKEFARNETRFRMVEQQDPARFQQLMTAAQQNISSRVAIYEQLAKLSVPVTSDK